MLCFYIHIKYVVEGWKPLFTAVGVSKTCFRKMDIGCEICNARDRSCPGACSPPSRPVARM